MDLGMVIASGILLPLYIYLLIPIAERLKLLDVPNERKFHDSTTPLVGGVGVYLVMLSGLFVFDFPEKVNLFFLSSAFLVAIGVLDDRFGLGVRVRLVAQVTLSFGLLLGGQLWIRSLGVEILGDGELAIWVGIPFTIFAVVGLTNAFNMIDGIDGLASGLALVGLGTIAATLLVLHGNIHLYQWLASLMAAVSAFWLVNLSLTPLRRVFLGDAGSLLLGFVIAWALIYYTQDPIALLHPVAALWCVTIPVWDTLTTVIRRLRDRRSPFRADRKHIHHLLISLGLSDKQTLFLMLLAALLLNGFGVWSTYALSPDISLGIYFLALILWLLGTFLYLIPKVSCLD